MRLRTENSGDSLLHRGEEPPLAAHLVTPRTFYSHHGIYVGHGRVIHYSGLAAGLRRGPVEATSLERFAQGHEILIRHDERLFDPAQVIERARSRLGENRFRLLTNNCEHLCAWVLRAERRSHQVERLHVMRAHWFARRARHTNESPDTIVQYTSGGASGGIQRGS